MIKQLAAVALTLSALLLGTVSPVLAQYGTRVVVGSNGVYTFSASAGDTITFVDEQGARQLAGTFSRDVNNGVLTISSVATPPAPVPSAPGTVLGYKVVGLRNFDDSYISSAVVYMAADNARLAGVNNSAVAIYRYQGSWAELPTSVSTVNDRETSFEADSPGFSVFALAAPAAGNTQQGGTTQQGGGNTQSGNGQSTPSKMPATGSGGASSAPVAAGLVVLLLVASATVGLRTKRVF